MRFARSFLWTFLFLSSVLFLNSNAFAAVTFDDFTPEVTARVARISFLRGDVQIRRGERQDDAVEWERATLNLPLVEGDEIVTGPGARLEIQLDVDNHLRLAENSYLKLTKFGEEGVAVSLPQGTLSVRLRSFDKERSYFEIDAPETTLAVETAGLYRVDAGDAESETVAVSAAEEGEARVYTKTSGFTLRSGRAARILIEGRYAGDYETAAAARDADEFAAWTLERDAVVAKRLKEAYYDKYYDRDMYGAEDLNEYGEWIQTRKYGWVWKPFPGSVASYANWSPYRYGHWRWVPVYGWTWVNDEPWGWATYHHGRWIHTDGYWVWTPYGQRRWRRSWWRPAMISIVTWNGSTICWYPLPYEANYYEFNRYYSRRTRVYNNTTIINNNTTVIVNPTPNPTPAPPVVSQNPTNDERGARLRTPNLQRVPPGAVIAVDVSEFGRQTRGYRTPPLETAKKILAADQGRTPPILPSLPDLNGKMSREILIENPRAPKIDVTAKTGATERKTDAPLDRELRQKRIFGNRLPVVTDENGETKIVRRGISGRTTEEPTRKTGSVTRPVFKSEDGETKQPSGQTPPIFDERNDFPTRKTGSDDEDQKRNERQSPNRQKNPSEEKPTPPIYVPPSTEAPPKREERRPQPTFPQRQESPKQREEPRREAPPPKREEPRPQPPPKQEPKQEPPADRKPSPPLADRKTKGDN